MSFILDALKKSEAERKRNDSPDMASIPTGGGSRSGSRWVWVFAVLLAVNLAALAVLVFKPDSRATTTASSPPGDAAPAVSTETRPAVAVVEPPPAARVIEPPPAERVEPAVAGERQAAVAEDRPRAELPGAAVDAPVPRPTVSEGLPTLNELRARGVLQLPPMHLDIHVYSQRPEDRFVFINMTKYRERDKLAEGPVVGEIVPDGVVMDYLGREFLLPRE